MFKKTTWIFLGIVLLGCILRFYKLGEVPKGFHRDEAFLGYNAYSLLKTGRDMSGKFLPLHFESFIYSPGGYSYVAILPIAIFGLNEFSVRFPSAFFGTATILLTFLLTKKLFPKSSHTLALFSSLFLAITPWHINLSRTATENTLVVFFVTLGVYIFLYWIQNQKILFLLLSFLSFSITLTLYQAPRAFLPIFLLVLIGTHLHNKKKQIPMALICYGVCIVLPVISILLSPTLATRMKTVSLWSTKETQLVIEEQIREDGVRGVPPLLSRIVHNKVIGYTETFLQNYFLHLSYSFLFTDSGLPDRYRVPNAGLLYIFMLPLLGISAITIFTHYVRQGVLLSGWVLISIIGSALTFDDIPNLQRTLLVFPALSIFMAFGLEKLLALKKTYALHGLLLVFTFLPFIEIYRYMHHYYVQQLVHRPWYRQEGYKELVGMIQKLKNNYTKIVITNRETAPTIFFLFYTQYDPKKFQEETKHSTFRDFDRINFSNYTFTTDECPIHETTYFDQQKQRMIIECHGETETLYINSGVCRIPKTCANILHTVKRGDQTAVFQIIEKSETAATLSAGLH
jgi:4-amino-4-deoxy-L-arabinose transferase-like glycosyltransferase